MIIRLAHNRRPCALTSLECVTNDQAYCYTRMKSYKLKVLCTMGNSYAWLLWIHCVVNIRGGWKEVICGPKFADSVKFGPLITFPYWPHAEMEYCCWTAVGITCRSLQALVQCPSGCLISSWSLKVQCKKFPLDYHFACSIIKTLS